MSAALYVIYGIHLAVFTALWWRRRKGVYVVLAATFVLLLSAHTLRVFAPSWRVGPVAAYWPPRVASWFAAATGLALLVLRRFRRRGGRGQGP